MARAPRSPKTPQSQNPAAGIDPTVMGGGVVTTGPSAGMAGLQGKPAVPTIDPKSVTTVGQVLSPNTGPQYGGTVPSQDMNAAWGPTPVLTDGMTFWEVGQTGLRQFSGWVREEFLQVLVGRQGAQKYREMMDNSPVIGGMLYAIQSTMRKVEWRVEPANSSGAAQEQADFIDSLREDMSSSWEDTIVENLSMLPYGYAFHEIVYKKRLGRKPGKDPRNPRRDLPSSKYDDGKIGWRRLPGRSQDTIIKWFFDENGTTLGTTQQPWVGPLIDIPIEKALLFRPVHYKNSPEGRSVLRNSYVPYYYAKRLQEQEAILFERLGGVPVIKIPGQILEAANAGDPAAVAAVNMYKRIAINMRTDEQMGLVLPSDPYQGTTGPSAVQQYQFELVAPQMRSANISLDGTITRYNTAMMTSVLADFLILGHEARGTQSLAVSKIDLFFQSIEGFLNSMAGIYSRFAIPRVMDLNGVNEDLWPTMKPDLAQRVDLDVLSNFILRISQAGMPLFPDEDLQSYIKDAAGLPDMDDSRALQAAGLTDDQLDRKDEMADQQLENMQQPPQPPGARPGAGGPPQKNPTQRTQQDNNRDNLEKMIKAGYAQRKIRLAGPRFGVTTQRPVTKSGRPMSRRAMLTRARASGHGHAHR